MFGTNPQTYQLSNQIFASNCISAFQASVVSRDVYSGTFPTATYEVSDIAAISQCRLSIFGAERPPATAVMAVRFN